MTRTRRKKKAAAHIRWMIRRDMPEVLGIESESFEFPWCEDDFIRCLRQRNCIGMAAERDETVVGFMVYELFRRRIHLLNFAVAPAWRRVGVGRTMVEKLQSKLSQERRKKLVTEVRESNLAAHLFFKAQGFIATEILRDYYKDSPEDAYVMEWHV